MSQGIDSTASEESGLENLNWKNLEKRISNIIEKIGNQRNIPCFQNIKSFLERGVNIPGNDVTLKNIFKCFSRENNFNSDILNSEGEASTSVILSLDELIKNDVFIKAVKEVVIKCVDIKLNILNNKQLSECKMNWLRYEHR